MCLQLMSAWLCVSLKTSNSKSALVCMSLGLREGIETKSWKWILSFIQNIQAQEPFLRKGISESSIPNKATVFKTIGI